MANLYYTNDQGSVIIEGGVVYERTSQTLGAANDLTPEVANITSYTYDTPDDQGITVYTAVQYAVSLLNTYSAYKEFENGSYVTLIASVPASGILRLWGGTSGISVKVNGAVVKSGAVTTEKSAIAVNVSEGDLVEAYANANFYTAYCRLLPFVYPAV